MLRKALAVVFCCTSAVWLAAATDNPASKPQLTAAEIVRKNVQARGGLQAWRSVQALTLSGKMGVGGNQRATLQVPLATGRKPSIGMPVPRPEKETELPFVMDLARPRKQRFELKFNGQTAIQVYDGANGWKLRPFLNRRDVEPFTAEETKIASTQADLDGPLVDYEAKGTKIELVGTEKVENRDTYKVKLTTSAGELLHVWIDTQTFLEAKIEGQPRRLDGTYHPVEIYYRDYRPVNGIQIPFVLETRVLPVAKTATGLRDTPVPPEKIVIDQVMVNPKLDAAEFTKSGIEAAAKVK
ncbi:MAG: outer membrane lipoprotein-sorting protein [Acidobacteria bacterium]|nr:MAG: outer membrane lipoprotein-sorting protein [Acidobacteriota bacterium]